MTRLLAAACLLAAAATASAEVRPTPGAGDPRIQTVAYDPDEVIRLDVATGYQLTLEFGPDERIENVAIGDGGAWQVTPNKRGDHLFVKATQSGVATNMTVITDSRTYNFALASAFGGQNMAFTVRVEAPRSVATAAPEAPAGGPTVGRYKLSGARALRPSAIDDDGVHTYIEWAPNQSLPAVFMIDPHGQETLVNGMMRDNRYVVDSVADRLLFRSGRAVAQAARRPRLGAR